MPRPEPYYIRREGWTALPDEPPPRPTYWPAVMAAGIMMLLWGIISSAILTGAGAIVFAVASGGWIRDLLHGRTDHAE